MQAPRELAKRIAAATISYMMDTSYATEYKRIGEGKVGDVWFVIGAAALEVASLHALAARDEERKKK